MELKPPITDDEVIRFYNHLGLIYGIGQKERLIDTRILRSAMESFMVGREYETRGVPSEFDRARETSRRQAAVKKLLDLGYIWRDGEWLTHHTA